MSENFYSIGNPRCKTCGFPIGNATRVIYNILKNDKIKSVLKEAELSNSTSEIKSNSTSERKSKSTSERLNNTLIDPEINIDAEDILNLLNINNMCCRTCLITWKKFE